MEKGPTMGERRLTQAVTDRGFAPWVSGAIFSNWSRAKPRQGKNRPGS